MTTVDTIRAVATYLIAALVVIGGFVLLRDAGTTDTVKLAVTGFIGFALNFVFGAEVQTRTARQAASQTAAANVVTNGNLPNTLTGQVKP